MEMKADGCLPTTEEEDGEEKKMKNTALFSVCVAAKLFSSMCNHTLRGKKSDIKNRRNLDHDGSCLKSQHMGVGRLRKEDSKYESSLSCIPRPWTMATENEKKRKKEK
jgi:hypothetical protein